MTSTNTEVLHRRTESWIVIQSTNVISHQSHSSPLSPCVSLNAFPASCSDTFTCLCKDRGAVLFASCWKRFIYIWQAAHCVLPIILCGKFKRSRTHLRSGLEEKRCAEEEHGERQGFWRRLRESGMLTECFKVFRKWIRVSGAQGPPLPSLTVSALMVANKSVRGDWQGAGCRPTFSVSHHFYSPLSFSVACGCCLGSRSVTAASRRERSLHKSSGIKETQLWVASKLNQGRNHLIIHRRETGRGGRNREGKKNIDFGRHTHTHTHTQEI